MLEDKVSKQDLQYSLANKVSVEELSRVLMTKSNIHEINLEMSQMNQRIDEIVKDYNKRLANCCL